LLFSCAPSHRNQPINPGEARHDPKPDTPPEEQTNGDTRADSFTGPAKLAAMPSPFIGSARCAECHGARAHSFQQTDHARSLRVAVAAEERELSGYAHRPSGQRFAVTTVGDQLHHRGWQTFSGTNEELLLCDAKIEYVMGSGAFGKSYLFRDGSAWRQSPLGYYVGRGEYGMSPGYDRAHHAGFSRQITDQCLFCHAGVVSRNQDNQNNFNVHELAIGCERCHGPGEAHAVLAEADQNPTAGADPADSVTDADWDIVHPANLNRDRLESICAQCHLQGHVVLYSGEGNAWSFRPGEDLGRRAMIYNVARSEQGTGKSIKFVGHFEQLRGSLCYQQSETLTCVTCHDPHGDVEETHQDEIQRSHCISCHANEHCTVPIQQRQQTNENRCWSCHMPRQDSDVPHVAVVNHLIGIYPRAGATVDNGSPSGISQPSRLPDVTPLLDLSPEDSWQRRLNEAVALATWLQRRSDAAYQTPDLVNRSIERLRTAIAGIPETGPDAISSSPHAVVSRNTVAARLADLLDLKLSMEKDSLSKEKTRKLLVEILSLAGSVLQTTERPTPQYESALGLLASLSYNAGDFSAAHRLYRELTGLRQRSADHYNLGLVCSRLGRSSEAEQAFLRAIEIQGDYDRPMASLGALYRSIDMDRARKYSTMAELLRASRGRAAAD
jgi:hypothetical protein